MLKPEDVLLMMILIAVSLFALSLILYIAGYFLDTK